MPGGGGGDRPVGKLDFSAALRACSWNCPAVLVFRSGAVGTAPSRLVLQFVPTQSLHWQNEANAPTLCLAILSAHLTIVKVCELGGAIFILDVRRVRSRDLRRPVLGFGMESRPVPSATFTATC